MRAWTPQAPARARGPLGRGDRRDPRHGRVVRRDLHPQPQEGPRPPGPDRLQPLLRELDPHPHQLQPGRQAALGRHPGLLRQRLEPLQGRDVHRHGQEHRGDGGRRDGRPAPHARAPPPAGPARRLLDHQRRRRRPRAPDPGPARPDDDPPRQGADRGPDRRPGRRHRPLAGRPVEHLGPDQARRQGHPLRPADPRPPGDGAARLRGRLPPRRGPAPLRRRERPADPVRAAAGGPLPLGRRVFAVLRDDPGADPAWPSTTCCCSPPGRSTAASS